MIPRYQKILFVVLILAALAMGVVLWQLRQRAHRRLVAGEASAPTKAPEVAPAEQATLVAANDAENSLVPQVHSLPLPADPGARARAVLGRLLDLYAAPDAAPHGWLITPLLLVAFYAEGIDFRKRHLSEERNQVQHQSTPLFFDILSVGSGKLF